jgi:hypothetical protein
MANGMVCRMRIKLTATDARNVKTAICQRSIRWPCGMD